jgi:hypothetical protein
MMPLLPSHATSSWAEQVERWTSSVICDHRFHGDQGHGTVIVRSRVVSLGSGLGCIVRMLTHVGRHMAI